ncbi:MAG: hypothetical protein V3V50_07600 [Gammaproteobacteria bacterium]
MNTHGSVLLWIKHRILQEHTGVPYDNRVFVILDGSNTVGAASAAMASVTPFAAEAAPTGSLE